MSTVTSGQANPYAPPQAEVADHRSEVQLASRLSRLGAFVLDVLGSWLFSMPLWFGADFEMLAAAALADDFASMLSALSIGGMVVFGITMSTWLGINLYLVLTNAQTVGKRLLGIKVARTDGSRAGFARIFWLRNIVNALPSLIPFVGFLYTLIDHLLIFGDARRCLHDRIAGTIVVRA